MMMMMTTMMMMMMMMMNFDMSPSLVPFQISSEI